MRFTERRVKLIAEVIFTRNRAAAMLERGWNQTEGDCAYLATLELRATELEAEADRFEDDEVARRDRLRALRAGL